MSSGPSVVTVCTDISKMGSSAVLLFTAAALLLVLAELGESAPAQEDQSINEASDGGYNQWREAVEKKQMAEAQAYYSPEQLAQIQNNRNILHIYCVYT